jgi:Arc/MetJ-type ribon-helix-helix transcriptional regulator
MTLTVRLPERVEQDLAEYCVAHGVSKSEAVKRALEELLQNAVRGKVALNHPFIGCDATSGDVARHTKRLLRERVRGKG